VAHSRLVDRDSIGRPFLVRPYVRLRSEPCRLGRGARSRLRRLRRRRWRGRGCRSGRRWRRGRLRSWGGRRRGCRGRVGGSPRRKQRQRIDVRVVVPDTHAEMNVRHSVLRLSGRSGLCNRFSLLHARAALHEERSEVRQGRFVTAIGGNRHGEAVGRHLSREGDLAAHWRQYRARVTERNVHAAVLPTCVAVVLNGKLAENWSIGRPRPRP
jgi:hypothetical protein